MASFIYDLNTREVQPHEQTGSIWGALGKLVGVSVGYYWLESLSSMVALQPLNPGNINYGKVPVTSQLKKFLFEKLMVKTVQSKFQDVQPILREYINAKIRTTIGQFDMGWWGYSDKILKTLGQSYKLMLDTTQFEQLVIEAFKKSNKQFAQKTVDEILQSSEFKQFRSKVEGQLLGLAKWSKAASIGLNLFTLYQSYSVSNLLFGVFKIAYVGLRDYKERKMRLQYYRRLQGVSGATIGNITEYGGYSRQEEQIILRSVQNAMVTKQIISDQGVFGTNPYLSIYG